MDVGMSMCMSMECPPLVDVAGEAAQLHGSNDDVIRPNPFGVHVIDGKIIPILENEVTPSEPYIPEMYSVVNVDGTYIPVERMPDGSRGRGIMSEASIGAQDEFLNDGWGNGKTY